MAEWAHCRTQRAADKHLGEKSVGLKLGLELEAGAIRHRLSSSGHLQGEGWVSGLRLKRYNHALQNHDDGYGPISLCCVDHHLQKTGHSSQLLLTASACLLVLPRLRTEDMDNTTTRKSSCNHTDGINDCLSWSKMSRSLLFCYNVAREQSPETQSLRCKLDAGQNPLPTLKPYTP